MHSLVGSEGRHFFEWAIEFQEQAYRIRLAAYGDDHPSTLLTLSRIPYNEAGRYQQGRTALDPVMLKLDVLPQSARHEVVGKYAYYAYESGDFSVARDVYSKLLADQSLTNFERATAESLLGFIDYERGSPLASVTASRAALDAFRSVNFRPVDPEFESTVEINLAAALSQANRHVEAVATIDSAMEKLSSILGDSFESYWTATRLVVQSLVHLSAGSDATARRIADKASQLVEKGESTLHYETSVPWMLLAWFDMVDGRLAECIEYLRRSVAIRKETLPAGHWRIALAEENLAFALRRTGDVESADKILLAWMSIDSDRISRVEPTEVAIRRLLRLAAALLRSSQPVEARQLMSTAAGLCENASGEQQVKLHRILPRIIELERFLQESQHV